MWKGAASAHNRLLLFIFCTPRLYPEAAVVNPAAGPLSACLLDNLLKTNDWWRDDIVWKQNACLRRRSGVMDGAQTTYLSFPSLSNSCVAVAAEKERYLFQQACTNLSSPGITLRMCKCLSIFVGTKKLSKHNVSQDLRPAVINLWESRWFICFTRIHRLHHISHSLQNLNLLYEYFTIKASLLSVLLIVCLALIYGGCECVCLSDLFLQAS